MIIKSLCLAILAVIFAAGAFGTLHAEIRLFAMPGGDVYADYYGWSAGGGASLENDSGIPWSVGLWYDYASSLQTAFSSTSQAGGLVLGVPLSVPGIPVYLVPLIYGGARLNDLHSGGSPVVSEWGGMAEPGMEIRFGFLHPFEIGLYGGYNMSYYTGYVTRSLHCGVSLAWVLPGASDEKSASSTATDVQTVSSTPVSTNTNTPLSAQENFTREVQSVLAASQTNAPVPNNTNIVKTNTAGGVDTNGTPAVVTNNSAPALETGKNELVIRFSEVLFDKGSAQPTKQTAELIRNLGNTFKKYPKLLILVEGHTDNQGDENFNLDLSEKRAKAVSEELYKSGVSRKQVRYQGFGDTDPVVPNDTEENRMKNRRVNIRVLFSEGQM
jgi:outer membrane protein OmpA-like peptidoglycan-associated protein